MMEAVILCGIQGAGKSSFYRERFFRTHVRINLDMLRTRHREKLLLRACLDGKQAFVVDNTNATRKDRERYLVPAREHGFRIVGYWFDVPLADALRRNQARPEDERVPAGAIAATSRRLEPLRLDEGFEHLYRVRLGETGFTVEELRDPD
jgi:predicted kinase